MIFLSDKYSDTGFNVSSMINLSKSKSLFEKKSTHPQMNSLNVISQFISKIIII